MQYIEGSLPFFISFSKSITLASPSSLNWHEMKNVLNIGKFSILKCCFFSALWRIFTSYGGWKLGWAVELGAKVLESLGKWALMEESVGTGAGEVAGGDWAGEGGWGAGDKGGEVGEDGEARVHFELSGE